MIGIVDYGMGNLSSVYNALAVQAIDVTICRKPEELNAVDRIILPGVGAFGDCLNNLRKTGFAAALAKAVIEIGKPILGICLGMQAMASRSFEGGLHEGLGWFDGDVVRLKPDGASLRIPHVGWNQVHYNASHPLFQGLPEAAAFYFVHSFFIKCRHTNDIIATVDYGGPVTAAIAKGHIFGTQFHPEKSQDYGLQILNNFACLKA